MSRRGMGECQPLRSAYPGRQRGCTRPMGKQISHLGRMPTLRRARRGRGRTCKRALRWRPAVRQTVATIRVAYKRPLPNLICRLSFLRVFRASISGNRNVHGFPAFYPACRVFPVKTREATIVTARRLVDKPEPVAFWRAPRANQRWRRRRRRNSLNRGFRCC